MQKTDKNTEKMYSTQQPTLLNIGCFWQYFVPMPIVLHANFTSFFRCCCISMRISSIIYLSGAISMAILCSCYMLDF